MKHFTYTLTFLILIIYSNPKTATLFSGAPSQDTSIFTNNYLVAYQDGVPVYKSPSKTSKIVGFLRELEYVGRYDYYFGPEDMYSKFDINASWFSIRFKNDTGWVNRYDNVSLKYDVDTFRHIVLLNKTSLAEMIGIGYVNTEVRNLKTEEIVINQPLDLDYCYSINDSLYVFNGNDSIKIYNLNSNLFIYEKIGGANTFCQDNDCIYYLKWSEDCIDSYGYHYSKDAICQLIEYDILLNADTVLFTESDLLSRPYLLGPDSRRLSNIKIKFINNERFLSFDLFKMRPNPIDEGDCVTKTIEVEVDNN